MDLFVSFQVNSLACAIRPHVMSLCRILHTKAGHRKVLTVTMNHEKHEQCQDFYLFDSGGQVLDEESSQVVECLQLSGLCENNKTSSEKTSKIFDSNVKNTTFSNMTRTFLRVGILVLG